MYNNTQFAEFSSNLTMAPDPQTTGSASQQANPGRSHHAAWGAFRAGMQFLQKYAGRSPGNSENIAVSNLQLLHRSLLKDPSYAQSLKKASFRIANSSLPSSHCIFNEKDLRADLLTLKSGTTIRLTSHQDSYAMYLSITGKPSIQSPGNTHVLSKHWWNRHRQSNHGESLKNGDAVLVPPQRKTNKLLTAEKNECILLRIQILKK